MADRAAEPAASSQPAPSQPAPSRPSAAGPAAGPSNVRVIAVAAVVTLLAAGWFLMSHLAMHTGIADALGEALGVVLGLLLVISAIGAVASGRRRS
jgi:hypothetical protein